MDNQQKKNEKLVEEITMLVQYATSEEERPPALALVEMYKQDPIALDLCKVYYFALPDAREEALLRIVLVKIAKGGMLFGLATATHEYLYVNASADSHYLGEYKDGLKEKSVLDFFGYKNNKDYLSQQQPLAEMDIYQARDVSVANICPACSAAVGKMHEFGCPVEICPWCEGQFNNCHCRFKQLGQEQINDEQDLDRLEEILLKKGRVPYSPEQGPSYPATSSRQLS